jgi:hypothetical protein
MQNRLVTDIFAGRELEVRDIQQVAAMQPCLTGEVWG